MRNTIIFLHIPRTGGTTFRDILERYYHSRNVIEINNFINTEKKIKSITKERRSSIHLIKGHLNFGIHKWIDGSYKYITFLRHPIKRTLSIFKYIKNKLIYCAGIREKYEDFSGNNFYYFSFLTSNSSSDWKPFTSKLPLEFDMRYFDIWFDKKSSINKILPFLSALKIQDYKNYIVSPYFQNVKLNNDSLIQPRKSINQYGNYSLFD